MEFQKKKLEILQNPQTFQIKMNMEEEMVKKIYSSLKSRKARDIIEKFSECGNPCIMDFDFETMSEDKVKFEIKKTEKKIKELEEKEKEEE